MSTTAATATATTANTSHTTTIDTDEGPPCCCWRGHIIAHNLPKGCKGDDFQNKHRPVASRIESGASVYRPCRLLAGRSFLAPRQRRLLSWNGDDDDDATTVGQETAEQEKEGPLETLLSVYIYPPNKDTEISLSPDADADGDMTTAATTSLPTFLPPRRTENIHLQMVRDSLEPATKTLTRMSLSIAKKVLPGKSKKHKKKKVVVDSTPPRVAKGADNSSAAEQKNHEVWVVNPMNDNCRVEKLDNVSGMTSQQLWNAAIEKSLLVELVLDGHGDGSNNNEERDDNNNNNKRVVSLLVESGGPFIHSVQTFQDFGPCLFPNVPVCVNVGLFLATHCKFDWYVGGRLQTSQTVVATAAAAAATTVTSEQEMLMTASATHVPDESDIGKELAVVLTPQVMIANDDTRSGEERRIQHSGEGCQEAYRFQTAVQARPPNTILNVRSQFLRPSSSSSRRPKQQPDPKTTFRVLTYNILADQNAFQLNSTTEKIPFFPYVSKEILARERRLPLILHEIISYQAQVLCLQEVDRIIFDTLLQPVLRQYNNYQGFLSCKEGANEGCAIFWSLDCFEHVPDDECQSVLLRELVQHTYDRETTVQDESSTAAVASLLEARPDLRNVLESSLGHVFQMVRLKFRGQPQRQQDSSKNRSLLVVNTHLFFHPQASHLRLLQAHMICCKLVSEQQQQEAHSDSSSRNAAMVFCGDFNSSLKNAAGKLIVDRSVPGNFRDLQTDLDVFRWGPRGAICAPPPPVEEDSTTSGKQIQFPDIQLPDEFPHMESAYPNAPEFTHYVDGFVETLDHILIQSNALQAVSQAPMPTVQDVTTATAMPSATLPSDHVSLVCDLKFRDDEQEEIR